MGDPKTPGKKYETPSHPWEAERIKREREILFKYGLKNKTEIWKIETALRRLRGQARRLLEKEDEETSEKDKGKTLKKLAKFGILPENSTLDDVLALNIEKLLGRRLQTLVYLHGLAKTPKQARQLIIHGHIAINGRKTRVPSYLVRRIEEDYITYSYSSPLNDEMHPMRPKVEEIDILKREEELKKIDREEKKKDKEIKEDHKEKKDKEEPKTPKEELAEEEK